LLQENLAVINGCGIVIEENGGHFLLEFITAVVINEDTACRISGKGIHVGYLFGWRTGKDDDGDYRHCSDDESDKQYGPDEL